MAIAAAAKVVVLLLAWKLLQEPEWFVDRLASGWDGGHYLRIAREGYDQDGGQDGSIAFAPLYPMLIRLFGGSDAAALALSNVASLAVVAVIAWHFGPRPAVFFALFPPFLVYGTVAYSEATFLLPAALAIALLERRHQVIAGLAGVAAMAARYMGGPALLLAALPWHAPRRLRDLAAAGILAVAGAVVWVWLWMETGDFFGYFSAQKAWYGGLAWPWEHVDELLHGGFTNQGGTIEQGELGPIDMVLRDAMFLVPAVWGLAVLWKRPGRRGTFAYSAFLIVLAICTVGLPATAFPRYLAAAFPAIAILGDRVGSRAAWAAYATLAILFATQGLVYHLGGYWS